MAGWVLTITGAVLLAAAGSAAYTQYQDTQTYQNPTRDASTLIISMTAEQGRTLADSIDRNRAVAGVCAVLGATSLGLGIWQLTRSPAAEHVMVLPTANGAALAGRF